MDTAINANDLGAEWTIQFFLEESDPGKRENRRDSLSFGEKGA